MFRFNRPNIDQRLPSYTIMDVLMGMVVTSLVISVVFFLLTSVNKQNHIFQQVRLELNDYLILNNMVKRELDQTSQVFEVPNGLVFQSGTESIHYLLKDSQLLRADELSEKVVYENCTGLKTATAEENNLVTDFDLKLIIQERELTCHFHKDYGKSELINNTLLSGI